MKACGHCKERAERRFKDGWGVLACADWFSGTCEGEPLDVSPPDSEGRDLDEDEQRSHWVKMRLREVWPMKVST
jgi:hypothetical protein